MYLPNGRGDEYDVDTRTTHVCRAQRYVDEYLAEVGPRPDRLGPAEEGRLRRLGVVHLRRLGASTKYVGRAHQDVHAVGAYETDQHRADPAEQQPAVPYRIRHGQDAGSQGGFQEMRQGTKIPET